MLIAALAACSRAPQSRVERLALLPFENLTGDATLDWVASAAPAIVGAEITGDPKIRALRALTVSDAYSMDATEFLHGYFTGKPGDLRFEMETENAAQHKMVANVTETGSVLSAMNALARRLDSRARPFSTSNADAVAAWGRGDFERAVALDPDFGAAWLGWIESLASHGEKQGAIDAARRALERPALRSDVDRVKIELASAALNDNPPARQQALIKLIALVPDDLTLRAQLAETELNQRQFASAAGVFQKIVALDPANVTAMNSLGYAEAQAGDLDAARKAFEEYGSQPGQKTNSLDSMGEAYFINGRFTDAEKYFLEAQQSNPSFLGGGDLKKAAYARWLAGDLPGADALMKRYVDLHANDPLRPWREAAWLYSTGRRAQATALLETLPQKQIVQRQLAIWNAKIPEDAAAWKQRYERAAPPTDGQARTFYAAALIAAGEKDQARKLLTLWPLPDEQGDPMLESLVYPKFIELRKSVGLPR